MSGVASGIIALLLQYACSVSDVASKHLVDNEKMLLLFFTPKIINVKYRAINKNNKREI